MATAKRIIVGFCFSILGFVGGLVITDLIYTSFACDSSSQSPCMEADIFGGFLILFGACLGAAVTFAGYIGYCFRSPVLKDN